MRIPVSPALQCKLPHITAHWPPWLSCNSCPGRLRDVIHYAVTKQSLIDPHSEAPALRGQLGWEQNINMCQCGHSPRFMPDVPRVAEARITAQYKYWINSTLFKWHDKIIPHFHCTDSPSCPLRYSELPPLQIFPSIIFCFLYPAGPGNILGEVISI